MYCIISSNTSLNVVAWGPFRSLAAAKKAKKKLERVYPQPDHLILSFQDFKNVEYKDREKRTST